MSSDCDVDMVVGGGGGVWRKNKRSGGWGRKKMGGEGFQMRTIIKLIA